MADLELNDFDARNIEPTPWEPIPPGKYLAAIIDSDMRVTKNGLGKYLQLTFEILDGQYRGRHLVSRLNLHHPNADTVRIARAELAAICRAAGIMTPKDSCQLHNIPIVITVQLRTTPTGELRNEIRGYAKPNEQSPGQPGRSQRRG